ncbi:MAG: histidinol-phosphate transaminase, partial [Nitrospirae bacterium]|nr:histidinol-phosphate transaminase [Nitrospirota bacterium]
AVKVFFKEPREIGRYPDGGGYYLKNALAEKLTSRKSVVTPDDIILGNGSNELIDIAVRTYMGQGDEAVMAAPSFVVYAMAVRSVGGTAVEIPLLDYRHDLMKMADAVTAKTKMVFIANPNNPTGTINNKDEFAKFMRRMPDNVLVVVDEAYYEYVTDRTYPDTLRYFMEKKAILILRTFSKAYGLAGMRIGYGIAKNKIIAAMNKIREPFNTNSLAQTAALHALSDKRHIKKSVAVNNEGKEYLYKELKAMGLRYVPTDANFIYMPLDVDSKGIYDALLHEGVIVRPVGAKQIRVTIGLPEENKRFIEAINIVMARHNVSLAL